VAKRYSEDDRATDVVLIGLARLMERRADLRAQMLAEMGPEFSETYWAEVTEARERLGITQ
jgi:hypothetical protein